MDEIVRRLRSRNSASLKSLKESMPVEGIREADEDEENIEAPAAEEIEDIPAEDTIPDEVPEEEIDTPEEEESEEDEKSIPTPEEVEDEHTNPLDNMYAVNYKIGQEVVIAYSNGNRSKLAGIIDGYDKEGFYRIKWYNGRTTNGITDLAITELVDTMRESKCVCGGTDFVHEGDNTVCDKCGRIIGEGKDALSIADKARPAGKRMIRSEAHPMSTAMSESISDSGYAIRYNYEGDTLSDYESTMIVVAGSVEEAIQKAKKKMPEGRHFRVDTTVGDKGYIESVSAWKSAHPQSNLDISENKGCAKKSIEETIRSAFSKKKDIKEAIDADEEDVFSKIKDLKGEFWTRSVEMLQDIRELGYDVMDANSEYVLIATEDEEGEDHQLQIPVVGTARTIALDIDKARIV